MAGRFPLSGDEPVSMFDPHKVRRFRLALTIQDNPEVEGAHALLALAEEPGKDTPVLAIQAGGFTADAEGAALLANMLRDAAEAIDSHLSEGEIHHAEQTPTSALPVVKRPRFNPRPMGGK